MASESSTSSSLAFKSYNEGPPWLFKGRAFYQFHAVKSSLARQFIPPELKLVEAFGYTLGGLFLAHYEDSPAGEFDEAVVIAGIVWNAPTSCAWAGRILVNSEEARAHGRQEVGLPSHFASFSHKVSTVSNPNPQRPWWDARTWFRGRAQKQKDASVELSVEIVQRSGRSNVPLCQIVGIPRLSPPELSSPDYQSERWKGPAVQLYLPNFSGRTAEQPSLLKYSCALNCRVSVVGPAKVINIARNHGSSEGAKADGELDAETRDVLSILTGKPLASILFHDMVMRAGAPTVLALNARDKKLGSSREIGIEAPAASS